MSTSPTEGTSPIRERAAPSPTQFRDEIVPGGRPVVLRGVASDWPLVVAARGDAHRCMAMLALHAARIECEILRANPEEEGRFHYSPDGQSLNFLRGCAKPAGLIAALREEEEAERPYAMVAQGLIAERYFPGFAQAHPMPLVPASAEPRLWVGNAAKIATHNDPIDNVAVVAAGRRRFTLFPPEAEADLYMGPDHPTPAGTPVSMVHVTAPDFDRFPRYRAALERAQEAELGPGDAVFIPRNWFHHVEALERFNVLVNYWWGSKNEGEDFDA
jgi:Cupin-like domain